MYKVTIIIPVSLYPLLDISNHIYIHIHIHIHLHLFNHHPYLTELTYIQYFNNVVILIMLVIFKHV